MIEWILSTAIGIFLVMLAYQAVFLVTKKLSKRGDSSIREPTEMWRSSALVSPIIILFSSVYIALFSLGDFQNWGFIVPPFDVLLIWLVIGLFGALIATSIDYFGNRTYVASELQSKSSIPAFVLLVIVLASISEELLFRGFLQQIIDSNYFVAVDLYGFVITSGVLVAGVLFGLVHTMPAKMMNKNPLFIVIAATILGVLSGIALASSGSLLLSIIIHMQFNTISLVFSLKGIE